MDTKEAGRIGGLQGGKSKSERKVSASRRNLELARKLRHPSRIGIEPKNQYVTDNPTP